MNRLRPLTPIRQRIAELKKKQSEFDEIINQTPEQQEFCEAVDSLYEALQTDTAAIQSYRTYLCELEEQLDNAQRLLTFAEESQYVPLTIDSRADENPERKRIPFRRDNPQQTEMAFSAQ